MSAALAIVAGARPLQRLPALTGASSPTGHSASQLEGYSASLGSAWELFNGGLYEHNGGGAAQFAFERDWPGVCWFSTFQVSVFQHGNWGGARVYGYSGSYSLIGSSANLTAATSNISCTPGLYEKVKVELDWLGPVSDTDKRLGFLGPTDGIWHGVQL